MLRFSLSFALVALALLSCKPSQEEAAPPFYYRDVRVNGQASADFRFRNVSPNPVITLTFSAPVQATGAETAIRLTPQGSAADVPLTLTQSGNDTTLTLTPRQPLRPLTAYVLSVAPTLTSRQNVPLASALSIRLTTAPDSTDKAPRLSDAALLDLVQRQTFRYFWEFGHPVSGMARERNASGDVVTTGGTGFGVMAMVVAVQRQFVSRRDGLARIRQVVDFLTTKATRYHGAFAHWINGATGATVPFSPKDNGADLVETAYLMQGLLTARQYFDSPTDPDEAALRQAINALWNGVEWGWFTRDGTENVLYWHWSPTDGWAMNLPIRGWNEALLVYVLAAASNASPIAKAVYDQGWAQNGRLANGNAYYGVRLPLGPAYGGPLFFSQYSFLGLDPRGLTDAYADYGAQNTAHTRINYAYCAANPKGFTGYGPDCWGLTASDDPNGYAAHDPVNDNGTISPTAALSALPYAPDESMRALRFFYYKLGDRLWKDYGFVDAFNLTNLWFADSFLAIDQGPIVVMIENYRSGLPWQLFMSCPEVKRGLTRLGFRSPAL
jgi:hypothetical protein